MGLFDSMFGNKNKKLYNEIMQNAITVRVRCPRCGKIALATFIGMNDSSYSCKSCGYHLSPRDKI